MNSIKGQKETFIGEQITPENGSFSASRMASGKPGLPESFTWKGRIYPVLEVVEEWKETGDCRHGSGERYVRKHWFRIRTEDDLQMKIYFERQSRSRSKARWRLYTIRQTNEPAIREANSGRLNFPLPGGEGPRVRAKRNVSESLSEVSAKSAVKAN